MGGLDWGAGEDDVRAVTPVVAIVVLVGLVIVSAVAVFVVGSGALFAMQDDTDVEQAASAMEQLSHDVHSGTPAAASLPHQGTAHVDSSAGTLTVKVVDMDNDTVVNDADPVSLGTLYYTSGGSTVAYQGGGIWRTDGGSNSTMVSPPPLQYRDTADPTLNFPVVTIQGPDGTYDGRKFGMNGTAEREFAAKLGDQQHLVNRSVVLEIESEYYLAWADYLEDQFQPGDVTRDHGANAVEVNLSGVTRDPGVRATYNVTNGYSNVTGITGFLMNDGPSLHPREGLTIDSYNSDRGPYGGTPGENGSIISDGDVKLANDATINGDVVAEGVGTFSNDVEVTGSTLLGAQSGETLVDTDGGTTFHGIFSTKHDVEITGGVEFDDHVIVGGDLGSFDGDVNGSLFVHGDVANGSSDSFEGTVAEDVVMVGNDDVSEDDLDISIGGDLLTGRSASEVPPPLDVDVSAMNRNIDLDDERIAFKTSNDNCDAADLTYRSGLLHDDPCDDDSDDDDSDDSPDYTYGDSPDDPARLDCHTPGPSGDTCRLDAGDYYVNELSLDDYGGPEELIIDTTDGPVNIFAEEGMEGAVDVNRGGSIEVVADDDRHPVTIYSNGQFRVREGGSITVPDDRTPLFRTYVDPDSTWRVSGGSTFMGAVFGLSDGSSRTTIDLSGGSGSSVYGAMLGNIDEFDQTGTVHYDEALAEVREPDTEIEYSEEASNSAQGAINDSSADVEYLNLGYTVLQGD